MADPTPSFPAPTRPAREPLDAAVATALRFTLTAPGVHNATAGTTRPERCQRNAAQLEEGALPASEFNQFRARWLEIARPSWAAEAITGNRLYVIYALRSLFDPHRVTSLSRRSAKG